MSLIQANVAYTMLVSVGRGSAYPRAVSFGNQIVCACCFVRCPTSQHKKYIVLVPYIVLLFHPFSRMHKKKPLLFGMCKEVTFVITFRQNENNLISCHIGHNSKKESIWFFWVLFFGQIMYLDSNQEINFSNFKGLRFMHFKIKVNANVIQGEGVSYLFVLFCNVHEVKHWLCQYIFFLACHLIVSN